MTTQVLRQDIDQLARSGLRPEVTKEGTKLGELQAARGRLWDRIEDAEQAVQDPENLAKLHEELTVDDVRDYYRQQVSVVAQERAKRILESKGNDRVERSVYALRVEMLRQQLAGMRDDDRSEALLEAAESGDKVTLEAILEGPKWLGLRPPEEFASASRAALDRARGLDDVVEAEAELEAFEIQLVNADAAVREIKARAEAAEEAA